MYSTLMHVKMCVAYVMEMIALLLPSLILQQGPVKEVSYSMILLTVCQMKLWHLGYVNVGIVPRGARDITIMETSPSGVIGTILTEIIVLVMYILFASF